MLIIKLRLVHVTLLSISYVLSKVVYNRREKSLVKMRIIRLMGLLGSLGSENEHKLSCNCLNFFFFDLFRAAPVAYGCSQARGRIAAVCARSEPRLQPWQCQILNPPSEARDQTCVLMDTSQGCFC